MAGQTVVKFLGFFTINQDEIGVKLSLGKLTGEVHPGLNFAVPIVQTILKTKSSLQTVDLPDQQIVLSGNISVTISGNLNFRVVDPARALLSVSNYRYSIQQLALTTISDVLGTKEIEDVRTDKGKIADEIERVIRSTAEAWGLADIDIRLTDARMDESLLRAMMRETEARKEAMALQIKAESDREVAQKFCEAATTLGTTPGAMTLRVLQTLSDVSNDKSTIVVPIPLDFFASMKGGVEATATVNATDHSISQDPAPTQEDTEDVAPLCKLGIDGERTVATCPHCQSKFNVTEIIGNSRYDRLPDVPGQQIKCGRCQGIFTLPDA